MRMDVNAIDLQVQLSNYCTIMMYIFYLLHLEQRCKYGAHSEDRTNYLVVIKKSDRLIKYNTMTKRLCSIVVIQLIR